MARLGVGGVREMIKGGMWGGKGGAACRRLPGRPGNAVTTKERTTSRCWFSRRELIIRESQDHSATGFRGTGASGLEWFVWCGGGMDSVCE